MARWIDHILACLLACADSVPDVDLVPATVSRLEPVGLGDRACIDLVELLAPGEGALLGSFARGLFLVHSECLSSEYIRARPFRVNAGAIHSYVMRSQEKTGYLSELASGQEVLSMMRGVSVSRCFGVSVFRCLGVSMFRCLGVSISRSLDVSISRCLNLPAS